MKRCPLAHAVGSSEAIEVAVSRYKSPEQLHHPLLHLLLHHLLLSCLGLPLVGRPRAVQFTRKAHVCMLEYAACRRMVANKASQGQQGKLLKSRVVLNFLPPSQGRHLKGAAQDQQAKQRRAPSSTPLLSSKLLHLKASWRYWLARADGHQ